MHILSELFILQFMLLRRCIVLYDMCLHSFFFFVVVVAFGADLMENVSNLDAMTGI